jgi:23S rRNA pseudouridine1911/1915/1917 synthase
MATRGEPQTTVRIDALRKLDILYEDNHLLVVNKPAGIATMGDPSGPTLHALAAEYLKHKYHKPGNVFVGVVSRLDSLTSGVIVFARTSKAASRLVPQFGASGQKQGKSFPRAQKLYLAAIAGELSTEHGRLLDLVRKDDQAHRMRVVDPGAADALPAELQYLRVGFVDNATIVVVRLHSGRKHQIRLQFADRGHPVLGDRKYGSRRQFAHGVALHSWRLTMTHPTLKTPCTFVADPPASWQSYLQSFGVDQALAVRAEQVFGLDGEAPRSDLANQ